jgi:hypothetical protein
LGQSPNKRLRAERVAVPKAWVVKLVVVKRKKEQGGHMMKANQMIG